MRGFMCQDPTATAMCMTTDPRSMIMPHRSTDQTLAEHASLINNNTKYARIAKSRRVGSASKKPTMPKQNERKIVEKEQNAPQRLSLAASSDQVFQVVVMRVSLHCQGCAGKVKKHLSKMEGVTSFSIDLENKRVTVRGHVSPVGVLESISKVKRAEFWPC